MTIHLNFADKVARANILAAYLDGTAITLQVELTDRGWTDMIWDNEFLRLLNERASQCEQCGDWVHADRSCDCASGGDWDYA